MRGVAMRRFRPSMLMLLVVSAALCVALVVQHDRAARREAGLQARKEKVENQIKLLSEVLVISQHIFTQREAEATVATEVMGTDSQPSKRGKSRKGDKECVTTWSRHCRVASSLPVARRACRNWSSRQGVRPGLPGMSSSLPSTTIRTRSGRINPRCGGFWRGPRRRG